MKGVRRCAIAVVVAAPLCVGACGRGHDVKVNGAKLHDASLVRRDSTRALGPGDVRITSQDSSVEVAIVGDSMIAGLGPRVRDKADRDLDTNAVGGDGLGASIEKMVKGTVAKALDHELQFPLAEISDVQADDGRLIFFDRDGKPLNMLRSSGRDSSDATVFFPDDAEAFVAAFKAKKASHG